MVASREPVDIPVTLCQNTALILEEALSPKSGGKWDHVRQSQNIKTYLCGHIRS